MATAVRRDGAALRRGPGVCLLAVVCSLACDLATARDSRLWDVGWQVPLRGICC